MRSILVSPAVQLITRLALAQPVPAEEETLLRRMRSVVTFCCDFSHHPAITNMKVSHHGCDVTVAHDRHPHLRLLGPGSSLTLRFSLPEKPKTEVLEAVHLANEGPAGQGIAPVTVMVNGRVVVQETSSTTASKVDESNSPSGSQSHDARYADRSKFNRGTGTMAVQLRGFL